MKKAISKAVKSKIVFTILFSFICLILSYNTIFAKNTDLTICKQDTNGDALIGWTMKLKPNEEILDTVSVSGKGEIAKTNKILPAGTYSLTATGAYTYAVIDGKPMLADARFSQRDGFAGDIKCGATATNPWVDMQNPPAPCTKDGLNLRVSKSADLKDYNTNWGNVFSSEHIYKQEITIDADGLLYFGVTDSSYGDNIGEIKVEIKKKLSPQQEKITNNDTDQKGCAVFNAIEYGKYTIEEIMQNGWKRADNTIYKQDNVPMDGIITVDDNQTKKYIFVNENTTIHPLTICKQDVDGNRLPDWTIKINGTNNGININKESKTLDNGCIIFNIPYGNYKIEEIQKPDWTRSEKTTVPVDGNITFDENSAIKYNFIGNYGTSSGINTNNNLQSINICKEDDNGSKLDGWNMRLEGKNIGDSLRLIERLQVLPNGTIVQNTNTLQAGTYVIRTSGTYSYGPSIADGAFSKRDNIIFPLNCGANPSKPWVNMSNTQSAFCQNNALNLRISLSQSGEPFNTNWGDKFNTDHIYQQEINLTQAGKFSFNIFDDNYQDNTGSLNVEIYQKGTENYPLFTTKNGITGENNVKGCVTFENIESGTYSINETLKQDWVRAMKTNNTKDNVPDNGTIIVGAGKPTSYTFVNQYIGLTNQQNTAKNITVCKEDTKGNKLPNWEINLEGKNIGNSLELFDSFSISSQDSTIQSNSKDIQAGNYIIKANGSYSFDGGIADAGYTILNGKTANQEVHLIIGTMQNLSNGQTQWGQYNAYHNYEQNVSLSQNGRIYARIEKGIVTNPSGVIRIDIYRKGTQNNPVIVKRTLTTGEDGCGSFSGIDYGNYTISENMQDGWIRSSESSRDSIPADGKISVSQSGQSIYTFVNKKVIMPNSNKASVTICTEEEGVRNPLKDWTVILEGDQINGTDVVETIEGDKISNMLKGNTIPSSFLSSGKYIVKSIGTYFNGTKKVDGAFADMFGRNDCPSQKGTEEDGGFWVNMSTRPNSCGQDILNLKLSIYDTLEPYYTNWGSEYNSFHTYEQELDLSKNRNLYFGVSNNSYQDIKNENMKIEIWKKVIKDVYEKKVTAENGCVTIQNVDYGTYKIREILPSGWKRVFEDDRDTATSNGIITVNGNKTYRFVNKKDSGCCNNNGCCGGSNGGCGSCCGGSNGNCPTGTICPPTPTVDPKASPTPTSIGLTGGPIYTITPDPKTTITPDPKITITPDPNTTLTPIISENPLTKTPTVDPNLTLTPTPTSIGLTGGPVYTITPDPKTTLTPIVTNNPLTITPDPNTTLTPTNNPNISITPTPDPNKIVPALKIQKTNNRLGIVLTPGSDVLYTLKVQAVDNDVNNVCVVDLPPSGITYRSGTWKAVSSNITKGFFGDLTGNITKEPVYNQRGIWCVGDMKKDEFVTLSYMADISGNQPSGQYRDIAWSIGINPYIDGAKKGVDQKYSLMGDVMAQGYSSPFVSSPDVRFVGTDVIIARPQKIPSDNPSVQGVTTNNVTITEKKIIEPYGTGGGELPQTGAETIWYILSCFFLSFGIMLFSIGFYTRNNLILSTNNVQKRRKSKKTPNYIKPLAIALCFISMASMANAQGELSIRLSNPERKINQNTFPIIFTTLDTPGRGVFVTCEKKGPTDSQFITYGNQIQISAGGGSSQCEVNNSIINQDSQIYYFRTYAQAVGSSERVYSNEIIVEYNISGPGKPVEYKKEKTSDKQYTISFKIANDNGKSKKALIYRSTEKTFTADQSTKINEMSVESDKSYSYIDNVPEQRDYYYAVRAMDEYGNGSLLVNDIEVKTIVTTNVITVIPTSFQAQIIGNKDKSYIVNPNQNANANANANANKLVSNEGSVDKVDPNDKTKLEPTKKILPADENGDGNSKISDIIHEATPTQSQQKNVLGAEQKNEELPVWIVVGTSIMVVFALLSGIYMYARKTFF